MKRHRPINHPDSFPPLKKAKAPQLKAILVDVELQGRDWFTTERDMGWGVQ